MQTIFKYNNKRVLTFVFICCSIAGQGKATRRSLLYPGLLTSSLAGQLECVHGDDGDFFG